MGDSSTLDAVRAARARLGPTGIDAVKAARERLKLQSGDALKGAAGALAAGAISTIGSSVEGFGIAGRALPASGSAFPEGSPERIGGERAKRLSDEAQTRIADVGQGMQDYAESIQAGPRGRNRAAGGAREFLTESLPQGLGSTAGFLAMSAPFGEAGALGVALAGASGGMQQGYDDAKANGADEKTALVSGLLNAGLGLTEAAGAGGALARVLKRMPAAARDIALAALREGGQEGIQQLGGNLVAKYAYDEDRKAFQGVGQSIAVGSLVGVFFEAASMAGRPGTSRGHRGDIEGTSGDLTERVPGTLEGTKETKQTKEGPPAESLTGAAAPPQEAPIKEEAAAPAPQVDLAPEGVQAVERVAKAWGKKPAEDQVTGPSTPEQERLEGIARKHGTRV